MCNDFADRSRVDPVDLGKLSERDSTSVPCLYFSYSYIFIIKIPA